MSMKLVASRKVVGAGVLLVLFLAAGLHAQGSVSPGTFAKLRGNLRLADNYGPWWGNTRRWQAIHTDLKGQTRVLRQIAFRQGDEGATPRQLRLEVWLGHGDLAKRSDLFDKNYVNSPSQVMRQRLVTLPDWRKPPPGGYPAPFTLILPFDTPWSYDGKRDLVYEIRTVVMTNKAMRFAVDGVQMRDYNESPGSPYGFGCLATGRQTPMRLAGTARTFLAAAKHTFSWSATQGPPFARSTFLLGARRQQLLIQNLCTWVYVDQIFAGIFTFSDAKGAFQSPVLQIPFDRGVVGASVFAQAYSLDSRPGLLPVSATHGLELKVPPPPPRPVDVATVWSPFGNTAPRGRLDDGKAMIIEVK